MATYRGASAGAAVGPGGSITINYPTACQPGDLVIFAIQMFAWSGGTSTITTPANFNRLPDNAGASAGLLGVFWREAPNPVPASQNFALGGTSSIAGGGSIAIAPPFDGTAPFVAGEAGTSGGSTNQPQLPAVTADQSGELIVYILGARLGSAQSAVTVTPSALATERVEGDGLYGFIEGDTVEIATYVAPAPGAIAAQTFTTSATLTAYNAKTLALPAPVAVNVDAPSIPSGEAFGGITVKSTAVAPSIPSDEAFGTLWALAMVGVPSIPSAQAFGPIVMVPQALTPTPPSIPSAEAFGSPLTVVSYLRPPSIATSERFGAVAVGLFTPATEALLSAARKEALMLAGLRGTVHYVPRLFLSNIYADELTSLPGVTAAAVNLSNFRDNTWELQLDCKVTDAFDPERDWVLAAIDVWSDFDTTLKRYPLGLYRFDIAPEGTDEPEGSSWHLDGLSPEVLLMRHPAVTGFKVAPGASVFTAVRQAFTANGIPTSRLTLPPDSQDKLLPQGAYFDPIKDSDGALYIRIVNNLLSQGGFGAIQTNATGQFFASKVVSIEQKRPAVFYGPTDRGADHMILRTGIPKTVSRDRFANQVYAYTTNTNTDPPLTSLATNDNPNSKASVVSLGYTITKVLSLDSVSDQATLDLITRAELARSSSYHLERKLVTKLDPRRGPDEAYEAYAVNAYGVPVIEDVWSVTNFDIPLSSVPGEMTHTVTRNEQL